MAIHFYQDYWHYFDPDDKEYTLTEFQEYLNKNFPKDYPGDWLTHSKAENKLLSEGWRKVKNEPSVPKLEDVAGKFLVVGQHAEPRNYTWDKNHKNGGYWTVWNFKDLTNEWWRMATPDVTDTKKIAWGHSCWQIGNDGTLTFAGADYDSSD